MNILFIHQNFPAQFAGLLEFLTRMEGVGLAAIGAREWKHPRVQYCHYVAPPAVPEFDIINGEANHRLQRASAVAAQARLLRLEGFNPDIIIVHSGWSESLFLRDLFPKAKIICFCEYHYLREGGDLSFDPEFPLCSMDVLHGLRVRNALELAAIDDADACISPTLWQRSTYPVYLRDRIEVIHEGVDIDQLHSPRNPAPSAIRSAYSIPADAPVITYCARNLEPMRGFHVFMRTLPGILSRASQAHVVIVGGSERGYGARPETRHGSVFSTWKNKLLTEVGERIDLSRVHFTGRVSYRDHAAILACSDVHVYLTYPFVLSWSLLEAMAKGCALVASSTPPVVEFLDNGSARLVDFFDQNALADSISALLRDPADRTKLGGAAQKIIKNRTLDRPTANMRLWEFLRSI